MLASVSSPDSDTAGLWPSLNTLPLLPPSALPGLQAQPAPSASSPTAGTNYRTPSTGHGSPSQEPQLYDSATSSTETSSEATSLPCKTEIGETLQAITPNAPTWQPEPTTELSQGVSMLAQNIWGLGEQAGSGPLSPPKLPGWIQPYGEGTFAVNVNRGNAGR